MNTVVLLILYRVEARLTLTRLSVLPTIRFKASK